MVGWAASVMDFETSEALTTLRADIGQVETSLRADIARVETTLGDRIDQVETTLGDRIARVETTLSDRIDSLSGQLAATTSSLRHEIHESKRHSEVLLESLRDDIRILAEGLVSLSSKVESLRPPERRP